LSQHNMVDLKGPKIDKWYKIKTEFVLKNQNPIFFLNNKMKIYLIDKSQLELICQIYYSDYETMISS